MRGHREVMGGAAAQINLTEVTKAVSAEAVDLGTVVGSIGRVGIDLDLKIDLVRDTHGKYSQSKHSKHSKHSMYRSSYPRPPGRSGPVWYVIVE